MMQVLFDGMLIFFVVFRFFLCLPDSLRRAPQQSFFPPALNFRSCHRIDALDFELGIRHLQAIVALYRTD